MKYDDEYHKRLKLNRIVFSLDPLCFTMDDTLTYVSGMRRFGDDFMELHGLKLLVDSHPNAISMAARWVDVMNSEYRAACRCPETSVYGDLTFRCYIVMRINVGMSTGSTTHVINHYA